MSDTKTNQANYWTWSALATALVAMAGSIYLSVGMELVACPLCIYQRTFVLAVVGVLGIGLLASTQRGPFLSLLCLPLALGGLGIAGFHVWLEWNGTLECPEGVFGLGSAPVQSLLAYLLLVGILGLDVGTVCCRGGTAGESGVSKPSMLMVLVLGGLFAIACIKSAPPMKKPDKPYKEPLRGCRPTYTEG